MEKRSGRGPAETARWGHLLLCGATLGDGIQAVCSRKCPWGRELREQTWRRPPGSPPPAQPRFLPPLLPQCCPRYANPGGRIAGVASPFYPFPRRSPSLQAPPLLSA